MYYVRCNGCGRFVMASNTCSYCLTTHRQEVPHRESYGSSSPPSSSTLPIVAGLTAAALVYLKTSDTLISAIAGGAVGLFATTPIGRTLFRLIFGLCALGAAWLIWQLFYGLSKTYR